MPKKHRLSGAQIRGIRNPRRIHGALFSLSAGAPTSPVPRFACIVSKKVAAKAVARNLIKRHCREVMRKVSRNMPAGAYVLTAKRKAAEASFADIARDIMGLLRRLG